MNVDILKVGKLKANCYILYINDKCLIIDPGDDEDFILSRLREIGTTPIGVIVTHNHEDHAKYAKSIADMFSVKVYSFSNLFEQEHYLNPFKFRVIYTPGHTSDSITLYFRDYNVMFTGDFLFKDDIGRTDLKTGSFKDMIESIKKISKYSNDIIVYPGHGKKTTLGHEKLNNPNFRI